MCQLTYLVYYFTWILLLNSLNGQVKMFEDKFETGLSKWTDTGSLSIIPDAEVPTNNVLTFTSTIEDVSNSARTQPFLMDGDGIKYTIKFLFNSQGQTAVLSNSNDSDGFYTMFIPPKT